MSRIVGILLAAGSAQRFGAHKLLQPLADGTPVGVAAARALRAALPDSIAVVRPDDHVLIEALDEEGLRTVVNPHAEQGMGSSLATGIGAAADADGWLIALADMPWIDRATMRMLTHSLRQGASMVAPEHKGHRGHPVGFARHWGADLRALHGHQGARSLIAAHPGQLVLHQTQDRGVLLDVDHPHDLPRQQPDGRAD
jgi:molybdenum cofactor cytidylyltransferase